MILWPFRRTVLLVILFCGAQYLLPCLTTAADNVLDGVDIEGYVRHVLAYRISEPQEVTQVKSIGYLAGKYQLTQNIRLRVAARAFYDAVYDLTNTYPANVERDQEAEATLRQALVDVSFGKFDAHVGLQQIVWGEAVGAFIADVVNPKDFREFVLPDFRELRLPLWAVDMTYYLAKGLVLEGVWTPHLRFNHLPEPGAEFAFFRPPPPPGVTVVTEPTQKPAMTLENSEGGARLSWIIKGWDLSLFYFDAFDYSPTGFTRVALDPVTSRPVAIISPRHTRVHYLGVTVGKSIEPVVLRCEIVATFDKFLRTSDPRDHDRVVRKHVLNYLLGLDYTLFGKVDVGLQLLQQIVPGATDQVRDEQQRQGPVNTAFSVRLETGFFENTLTPQVLFIMDTNRGDYRMSLKVTYRATGAITLAFGADIFGGPQDTLYGQFHAKNRLYTEVSYQF